MDFASLIDFRVKIKESENIDKYLNLVKYSAVKHEGLTDTSRSWCARNSLQEFGKWTGGTGNQSENRNHPNYSIADISLNTEKSPGDMWRLAVTQTLVKTLKLIWWENLAKIKVIIIIIIIRGRIETIHTTTLLRSA